MRTLTTYAMSLIALAMPIATGLITAPTAATTTVENPEAPSITFLDAEEAKAALVDDSADPFFSVLHPRDMSAKTLSPISGDTLEEQRQECRRRYQAAVREFSSEEKEFLRWLVGEVYPALQKDYPALAKIPWRFIKTSDEAEGGLPHTRGDHIVLAEGILKGLLQFKSGAPPDVVSREAGKLIVHEQFHVFQRSHRDLMASLYKDEWGFAYTDKIEEPDWLIQHRAVNPDGADCGWVFALGKGEEARWIWPQVVYREGRGLRRMPTDFRMVAIDLESADGGFQVKTDADGKPLMRDLQQVKTYTSAFPQPESAFHPHEGSATMFGEMVVTDSQTEKKRSSKPNRRLTEFRKWCRENLK